MEGHAYQSTFADEVDFAGDIEEWSRQERAVLDDADYALLLDDEHPSATVVRLFQSYGIGQASDEGC
jgi:hypothetical protein